MGKKKRPQKTTSHNRAYYSLRKVKQLIAEGNVVVRGNASEGAYYCFGWNSCDIFDAIKKLQSKHFGKSTPSNYIPGVMVDAYKARGLKGENVYTHFYIHPGTGKLIINSFKEI